MVKLRLLSAIAIICSGIFFSIPACNFSFIELTGSLFHRSLNTEFWNFGLLHVGTELIALGMLLLVFFLNPGWIKIAIPTVVLLFFIALSRHAANVPIHDDYYIILDFSNRYFFSDDISEKFYLLFYIWAESRLVTAKISVIIIHFLTDEVNFKYLILAANCCLIFILYLFYKSMPSVKFKTEITLVIALLLFQFGYYNAVVWATVALEYQLTILFTMLTLFLIRKKSITAQVAGILCAALAALSFGNGLLVFPLALLYFMIEKKWKHFFLWFIIGGAAIAFHLIDFPVWKHEMSFHSPLEYFAYSCCLLGCIFQFTYQIYLPFILGLFVWILFAVLTVKKYYRKNFFIYGTLLFVILSSLAAALFRLNIGLEESISIRHGIFSVLGLSASLVAFLEIVQEKKQKKLMPVLLFSAIIYRLLAGVFFFPEVPIRKQKLENFISDFKNNRPYQPFEMMEPGVDDYVLRESIEKKIYVP